MARCSFYAEHAPRLRHTGLHRKIPQPGVVVPQPLGIATGGLASQFKHPFTRFADRVNDRAYFIPIRQPTCIRSGVVKRSRRGKADGTHFNRFFGDTLHPHNFFGGRFVLKGTLAHHVGAKRGVTDVTGIVDAFGQLVNHVQELRERLPAPVDPGQHGVPGQVFSTFEIPEHQVGVFLLAGREGKAAVAHHNACHAVVARTRANRIPEDLGVHVGVTIYKPGGHNMTICINRLGSLLRDATNRSNQPVFNAHISAVRSTTRSVYHIAVFDDQVVSHDEIRLLSS